jgi:hypothetical protein
MLPAGFAPNRIRVTVNPERGPNVTRSVSWNEALHGRMP